MRGLAALGWRGSQRYKPSAIAAMKAAPIFKKALDAGVRMPLGTDAVARAHGQNAREAVVRVQAGQRPVDALISATSLAAESLGMGSTLGRLAPGYLADIIAVSGDPTENIGALRSVRFVLSQGEVSVR